MVPAVAPGTASDNVYAQSLFQDRYFGTGFMRRGATGAALDGDSACGTPRKAAERPGTCNRSKGRIRGSVEQSCRSMWSLPRSKLNNGYVPGRVPVGRRERAGPKRLSSPLRAGVETPRGPINRAHLSRLLYRPGCYPTDVHAIGLNGPAIGKHSSEIEHARSAAIVNVDHYAVASRQNRPPENIFLPGPATRIRCMESRHRCSRAVDNANSAVLCGYDVECRQDERQRRNG